MKGARLDSDIAVLTFAEGNLSCFDCSFRE